ncbi:MAG: hypothetical protein ACRDYW_09325 [Acidimicrobiales bacterium]
MVGLALGVLVLGQALRPGSILNLDFVLLPHAPVPNGVWGLGPELPRRTPLLLPLAWLDGLIGSTTAGKLLVVLCITVGFVGATRLATGVPAPWNLAAGLLYAVNPFTLTRLAVGHLFLLAAMALLPWVVRRLLDPGVDLSRTYLAALGLALTGVMGGVFATVLAGTGLVARPMAARRRAAVAATVVGAQAPWLAPGLVVWAQGTDLAGSTGFATDLGGTGGALRLLAGHGFWQAPYQVGGSRGAVIPLVGVALTALAVLGTPRLAPEVRWRLPLVGGVALAVCAASGAPALAGGYEAATSLPGGAVLREGQRILPLFLLWLAPAAALGGQELVELSARRRPAGLAAAPLLLALALVSPGIWGAGGQLRSLDLPQDWGTVRALVHDRPGTVLALPWTQYLELEVDGTRTNVLHPLPLWLGGDVLSASEPRLPGQVATERADPRERYAAAAVAANLRGRSIGADLRRLGVRWVAVLRDGDLLRGRPMGLLHAEALAEDPALELVLAGDTIDLLAVRGWQGSVVTDDGAAVPVRSIVSPLADLAPSGAATWSHPGATGWMRGLEPAGIDQFGLQRLPAGSGPLWYWPAVFVLFAYIGSAVAAAFTLLSACRGTLTTEIAMLGFDGNREGGASADSDSDGPRARVPRVRAGGADRDRGTSGRGGAVSG